MLINKVRNLNLFNPNVKNLLNNSNNINSIFNKFNKFNFIKSLKYQNNIINNNKKSLNTLNNNIQKIQKIQKFKYANNSKNNNNENNNKPINKEIKNLTKKDLEALQNKNISDKLDRIFKREIDSNKSNQKDKEFVLKKIQKILNIFSYLKAPVLLGIYPLAFNSPFCNSYSIILYLVNNYMILLTLLDSSLFFAAGLLNFLLNFKEQESIKESKNFRRLSTSFIFFSFVLFSAKFANEYMNIQSLLLLLFANFSLYVKSSMHVNLNLFTKDYILERNKLIIYNKFICIALLLLVYLKRQFYRQLI